MHASPGLGPHHTAWRPAGTAACPNGSFFCRNVGHRSKWLSSTFVDDGICDCCDGSDEQLGCSDTCAAKGAAETKQLRETLAQYEAGAKQRQQLAKQAQSLRKQWSQDAAAASKKVASMQPSVHALRGRKEALQQEKDDLEALKAPSAAAGGDGSAADGASAGDLDYVADEYDAGAAASGEEEEEWRDPRDPESWGLDDEDAEHDAYHAAIGAGQEAGSAEEDPAEVGRRIAAQWTSDPGAAGSAASAASGSSSDEASGEAASARAGGDAAAAADAADTGSCGAAGGGAACAGAPAQAKPGGLLSRLQQTLTGSRDTASRAADGGSSGGEAGSAAEPSNAEGGAESAGLTPAQQKRLDEVAAQLGEAQRKLAKEERALKQAERDVDAAQQKQEQDHGPDSVFAYLQDQCHELQQDKYTYRVCGFGKASQLDGGATTSLGIFAQFAQDFTHMQYTQGAQCWQGPPRSIDVALHCGAKTELLSVEEPSRCVYTATMSTPAMCTGAALEGVQQQINELTGSWQAGQSTTAGSQQQQQQQRQQQQQQQQREPVEEL